MLFYDAVYFVAYSVFLVGALLAMRGASSLSVLGIMGTGVGIDFLATIVPNSGLKSLAIALGTNTAILSGIVAGLAVWILFLAAVFARLLGRTGAFRRLVMVITVLWFWDLIAYIYGVHNF